MDDRTHQVLEKLVSRIAYQGRGIVNLAHHDGLFQRYSELISNNRATVNNYIGGIMVHADRINDLDSIKHMVRNKITIGVDIDPESIIDQSTVAAGELKSSHVSFVNFTDLLKNQGTLDWDLLHQKCERIAQAAHIVQTQSMVPIIHPRIYLEESEDIEDWEVYTRQVVTTLFYHLMKQNAYIQGLLIRLAVPGPGSPYVFGDDKDIDSEDIAYHAAEMLCDAVPLSVPAVLFSEDPNSTDPQTLINLEAINKNINYPPWSITYCFDNLFHRLWGNDDENIEDIVYHKIAEASEKSRIHIENVEDTVNQSFQKLEIVDMLPEDEAELEAELDDDDDDE